MQTNRRQGDLEDPSLYFKSEQRHLNRVKRTLSVYSLQGLGNCINNLPILLNLRKKFKINLHVMNNGSAKFFKDLEFDFKVYEYKDVKQIVARRFNDHDAAISFYPNWKREMFALLANNANEKICFSMEGKPYTYMHPNNKIKPSAIIHDIENNFKLLDHFGIEFEQYNLQDVLGLPNLISLQPIVSVHPTASTEVKYYPKEFWVSLIDRLLGEGFKVQMFSGPGKHEIDYCESICGQTENGNKIVKYYGQSFDVVAEKLNSSKYFIGLDSCLMHLSTMFGNKIIALWSYADYRRIYPYADEAKIYLPKERWGLKDYKLPKTKYKFLERACPDQVFSLLSKKVNPDHFINTALGNRIQIHKF